MQLVSSKRPLQFHQEQQCWCCSSQRADRKEMIKCWPTMRINLKQAKEQISLHLDDLLYRSHVGKLAWRKDILVNQIVHTTPRQPTYPDRSPPSVARTSANFTDSSSHFGSSQSSTVKFFTSCMYQMTNCSLL